MAEPSPAQIAAGIWICVPHGRTNCPRCVAPASGDVLQLRQQVEQLRRELAAAQARIKLLEAKPNGGGRK